MLDMRGDAMRAETDQVCRLCDRSFTDHKSFGRHLWQEHHLKPNEYRVQVLGIGPKCCNPKCNNSVPRSTDGGWHKACSPACAITMKVDIPLGFGLPSGSPSRSVSGRTPFSRRAPEPAVISSSSTRTAPTRRVIAPIPFSKHDLLEGIYVVVVCALIGAMAACVLQWSTGSIEGNSRHAPA